MAKPCRNLAIGYAILGMIHVAILIILVLFIAPSSLSDLRYAAESMWKTLLIITALAVAHFAMAFAILSLFDRSKAFRRVLIGFGAVFFLSAVLEAIFAATRWYSGNLADAASPHVVLLHVIGIAAYSVLLWGLLRAAANHPLHPTGHSYAVPRG